MRVVALIDGEHYPPVVRAALDTLSAEHEVAAAAFAGGTEKIRIGSGEDAYGVPVVHAATPERAIEDAISTYAPEAVVDLSDEPIVSSADRFRLASVALRLGVEYIGADFRFVPPACETETLTPTLAIVGTGKRVGKTAVSAHAARALVADGIDLVVLAMGRGGPDEPELIRGDEVALNTADLLALARRGIHAASDNYEDAVMARVATVGCRRCGGGMAGATFFSNVAEGALLADGLGKELLILEGSGAAVPPVLADGTVLVAGAAQGPGCITDYFGPLRLAAADLLVIAGAEEPVASADTVSAMVDAAKGARPELQVCPAVFRPRPLTDIAGRRVFYATTAPHELVPALARHLEDAHGCEVVGSSPHLSDRPRLSADLAAAAGRFDTLVTELKAAAVDVVAEIGSTTGVPTVLCDNVPEGVGCDLDGALRSAAALAIRRSGERRAR